MAFTLANWTCLSASLSQGQESVIPFGGSSTKLNAPNMFMYESPNDTMLTISSSNYFLPQYRSISVGDFIVGSGTDTYFIIIVTAVSSTLVTTEPFAPNISNVVSTVTTADAIYYPALFSTYESGAQPLFVANTITVNPSTGDLTLDGSLTLGVPLSLTSGGTGSNLSVVDNGLFITDNTGITSILANGTAGTVLTANSGAPPSWQAATATDVLSTTTTANASFYPALFPAYVTGSQAVNVANTLILNPSTGDLTASTGNITAATGILIAPNVFTGGSGSNGSIIINNPSGTQGVVSPGFLGIANNANSSFSMSIQPFGAVGQATAYYLPDPGTASPVFLLSDNATTQTINSGNLAISNGDFNAFGGHSFRSLANSAGTNGSLSLFASASAGSFFTRITNASYGQSTTLSIPDPGAANANFVLDAGTVTGKITFQKANGTEAANAVTASGQAGQIITSSLSTAGGSSYAITWTNTQITTTSAISLTLMGGSNTVKNITLQASAGAGTSTLTIYNNTVATSLNGTILIGYFIS